MIYYTGKDAKKMLMPLGVMKGRPKPSVKAVVMRTIVDHETMPKRNDYNKDDTKWKLKTLQSRWQHATEAVVFSNRLHGISSREPQSVISFYKDCNSPSSSIRSSLDADAPGIMYCGGAAPVVAELKEVSAELNVMLSVESFAW
eukprot:CAMPEP_0198205862 /NCGR_PEP_ID=MMETSP1445-20131203/9401_1 /TAXON_ID=36898 /ORGANISM="Pyramimonas sp., Strain CCMP2087" /LENGTH=143 /DNA_ID=CAMNT_0043878335 /DNA_START=1 /DNA_END=432 /DNA_ORIENTATION=-